MKRRPKEWKTFDKISINKQEENNIKKHHVQFTAKNDEQRRLIRAIKDNQIVMAESIAGTGKTATAVGIGMEYLNKGIVDKIIISRAAIEADGEKLGFVPGTLLEKMFHFLIPVYDEFLKYLSPNELELYKNQNIIEVCPFGYLRGRSFHRCYIIIDEAQNCSYKQLRMILTRLGLDSKMVIIGDDSQSDLPQYKQGALLDFMEKLEGLREVSVVYLDGKDVVRNPLVGIIIDRLDEEDVETNPYDRKTFGKGV